MTELDTFVSKIRDISGCSGVMDIATAREIVREINEFLYTKYDGIGTVWELGQNLQFFSDFHKYWYAHHREILNLQIDDASCERVADALHDVYVRTNGQAFHEIYDTNGLSDEDICRVRFLTANQDFRGSRNFVELSEIFLSDRSIFDVDLINREPTTFLRDIGITGLSQTDKRIQYAKKVTQFLIEHHSEPFDIIDAFGRDVQAFRNALIAYEGAGYGNKKTDMFIRDMVVLGVWQNVRNFDCIDVASDINTIRVALRTGILRSEIPLVSSFLDIFCYQYGYVDAMSALAWRRVWEYWNRNYPAETISSPCLLDYFVYNVVGKQFCKEILVMFECEQGHYFKWHSSRNKKCQICIQNGNNVPAKVIGKLLPCCDDEGSIAIQNTAFVREGIANPNFTKCPFEDICGEYGRKQLMPPKSISIMGQTGWTTAYADKDSGGGGLMA